MTSAASENQAPPSIVAVEASHRLQAAELWRRWRARRRPASPPAAADQVPNDLPLPPEVRRHYRAFSWVIFEQRLALLILGFLLAGCAWIWIAAWRLQRRPAVVVRAGPSLKEAAAAYYGAPEIAYDQLALFLHGCLPLLYAADDSGHPLLALAQGLVAPEIYRAAERRLDESEPDLRANRMTQSLALTGMGNVVADARSGRTAAYLRGTVMVTRRGAETRFFPWRARVVVAFNPVSRLDPYPFYLLRCDQRTGPEASAWDAASEDRGLPPP